MNALNRVLGLALVGAVGLVVVLSGCVSYTNVPEPSSAPAFKNANSGSSIKVISAAVERVVRKHPMKDAQGRYALNLPAGTTPETAQRIVEKLPAGAMVPTEGMESSVPVYHISRVWIRGRSGKVDVVYPLPDGLDGGVTCWMHGGDRPWYVERLQYWAPGTIPTPPIYVPIDGDVEVMDEVGSYEATSILEPYPTETGASESTIEEDPAVVVPSGDGTLYRQVDD
jgi:hypothetical protein